MYNLEYDEDELYGSSLDDDFGDFLTLAISWSAGMSIVMAIIHKYIASGAFAVLCLISAIALAHHERRRG